jgi:outer membrane protein TolC
LAVERLTQAERNVIYGIRSYSFFQNSFAVEIVNDYFDLLAQKDVVRKRYTNYLSRVQLTQRLEARAQDRERAADVDQARQAELSARNNYVNVAASYRNALDQFKIQLGLAVGEQVQIDDGPLEELMRVGLVPVALPRNQAYRLAVDSQFEILNAVDRFEDSKRKIKVAANELKTDLNVFAEASLKSDEPTDYTQFDPDKVQAAVGFELKLPLDRLRERNNYRATLISFESDLRELSLTLDTLRDAIDRGLRTLEQRRQNYQIQQNALQTADRRVDSNSLLLEAGRADLRDLVEAQDAQINAQIAVTAAIVSYQQVLLQLLLDVGVLETQSRRFWLKDHLAAHFPGQEPVPTAFIAPTGEVVPPHLIFEDTK